MKTILGALAVVLLLGAATAAPANAACWALRILEAATICIALVIWAVFLTDLMRRRMSRRLGMG